MPKADQPTSTPAPGAQAPTNNVLPYPTTRKRAYPQGYVSPAKLPDNAVRLFPPVPEITYSPLPPTGYLCHAILTALGDKRPRRKMVDKTLDALVAMMRRFEDDAGVRASVGQAVNMLCSRQSGRMAL